MYFEKDVFPCKKKDLAKEGPYYKDVCFEHGRQETREYYVENEISWLKANHPEWKGLKAALTGHGDITTSCNTAIWMKQKTNPGLHSASED